MNTAKVKEQLDLQRVKEIIFQDIDLLLDSFGLEYSSQQDNIFMRCPVHDGADNPQGCSISTKFHVWKCWTRGCHEHYGSDIFGFIKGVLDTDSFSDVLKHIAKTYNLNDAKGYKPKPKSVESDLQAILKHFHRKQDTGLQTATDFVPVSTMGNSPYFESRGFKKETLQLFDVEDCDDKYSKYRKRSIIPIYQNDIKVGYIARAIHPWITPKYLFSDGFRKTEYFYNWDRAILRALEKRTLFIVEGQGDVWRMYEAGVENCVGMFGKSMSPTQKKMLLTSGVTNLVILTDNDSAGREAKIQIKRDLGRLFRLIFPHMHTKDIGNLLVNQLQDEVLSQLKDLY